MGCFWLERERETERERERKLKMGDILIAERNDQRQPQIGKCRLNTEYKNIAF